MYIYYKKVESGEHMMFATEIAAMFGIVTAKDKPNSILVGFIIQNYIKSISNLNEPLYFKGFRGMTRVYSKEMYIPAIALFLEKEPYINKDKNDIKIYLVNGKHYNFKLI